MSVDLEESSEPDEDHDGEEEGGMNLIAIRAKELDHALSDAGMAVCAS